MKRIIAVACLVLALSAGVLLVNHRAPPTPTAPVVILPMPYSIPPQRRSLFDAWVPRGPAWAWLWHLREQMRGRPKTFDLAATLVDFSDSDALSRTKHSLMKPQFTSTNGLEIWLLEDAALTAFRDGLRRTASTNILSVARVITADRREAQLFSGNTMLINGRPTSVGLAVDLLPHLRGDATDLTAIITYSEAVTNQPTVVPGSSQPAVVSIQMNLAVAARIQIPRGTGVFLIGAPAASAEHKRLGVILSVTPPAPRK